MGPLTDEQIVDRMKLPADHYQRLEIDPFTPEQVKQVNHGQFTRRVIGYGPSGFGYDLRLGNSFRFLRRLQEWAGYDWAYGGRCLTTAAVPVIDQCYPDVGETCFDPPASRLPRTLDAPFVLQPGECVLGESVERLRIPQDVICLVVGKSTLARCFLDLNTTPLEPGWAGTVTIEIVNHASLPVRIRPGEGIAQVVFFAGDSRCGLPYDRCRTSSYQGQSGPTPPRHGPASSV